MDLSQLNEKQKEAVCTTEGPLRIIAVAGSGKTHTLISRVAYLVDKGVTPEAILLLTFTNKAAAEMKHRASAIADNRCSRIEASTYHSFCAKILRRFADKYLEPFTSAFTILSSPDVSSALNRVKVADEPWADGTPRWNFKKLRGFPNVKVVAAIHSSSINTGRSVESVISRDYEKYRSFVPEIKAMIRLYQQYKREHNMMDYDDLLIFTKELLQKPEIQRRVEAMYDYIMVDEYQDTNNLQRDILLLLRQRNHNIAVVGDDYQSIYAFRGANVNNILDFTKDFPECRDVVLDTNYRSNQETLDLANAVMATNASFGIRKSMRGTFSTGIKPIVYRPQSQYDEAEKVLWLIEKAKQKGIDPSDIAVLARTSNAFYQLEALLNERGISYDKYGGLKFFERECMADVVSYLRVLANPSDQLAWFRILKNLPGIGDTYADRIVQKCDERGFLHDEIYRRRNFRGEMLSLESMLMDVAGKTFELQVLGIIDYYLALRRRIIETAKVEDESTRTDMLESLEADTTLINMLPVITARYDKLTDFLDAITMDAAGKPDQPENAIVLSTIHSIKGLEYNTVIILDCVDGIFPRDPSDDEELRCFYVAMTRAKEHLFLMVPDSAMIMGKREHTPMTSYLYGCNRFWKE